MTSKIIVSLSGGKDSVAMLLDLLETFSPGQLAVHHQVIPEDWPETVPYVQELCDRLDVPLWMHQVLYEPVGEGTKVKRAAIRRVLGPGDIVSWDEGYIAGVTDLAMRRGWPPMPSVRYCTTYFKVQLVNTWIVRMQQEWQADTVIVALGERAAESPRRAKRSFCMLRPKSQRRDYRAINWMPIQHWSRRQVFRKMRDHGIDPHPCYKAQGMTDQDMYDKDVEGGPRTSCRFCIYATHADCCHQTQVRANLGIRRRIEDVESETLKTWWMNRSIKEYS